MHDQFGAIVQSPATIYTGRRVIVQGLLLFGSRQQAPLWVYEVVVPAADGRPTRAKYSYHFSYDGGAIFRYDRDQQHEDMPEHKHLGPEERRVPWGPVTLQEVVDELTAFVAEREAEEAAAETAEDE
jgi:hypothetical protein